MTHTGVGTTQKYRCAYMRTPRTYITAIGPPLVSISLCSVTGRITQTGPFFVPPVHIIAITPVFPES
jgi:hypothetical protein